jgi:hypothetical protein
MAVSFAAAPAATVGRGATTGVGLSAAAAVILSPMEPPPGGGVAPLSGFGSSVSFSVSTLPEGTSWLRVRGL